MSKKIWLIVAVALTLTGGILFTGAMTMLKWDFTKLSTNRYIENHYELTEEFKDISIDTDTANITFRPTDGKVRVECVEEENAKHTVLVNNGILEIKLQNNKKWHQYIGINFGSPKLTVYLPGGEYGKLSIKTNTGSMDLPGDFSFTSMDITATTGDLKSSADVSGTATVKATTGRINLENITAQALSLSVSTGNITASNVTCTGDMKVKVTTGKTMLTNIQCASLWSDGDTGDLTMNNVIAAERFSIERSTGDIKLEGCDAGEIYITTDTGDVTGTLLSPKVFITESDTGKIRVPESTTGGKCKISTDTGDIKITLE